MLATADALDNNPNISNKEYQEYIRPWFRIVNDDVVTLSDEALEWVERQDYNYNSTIMGIAVVRTIPCAWFFGHFLYKN